MTEDDDENPIAEIQRAIAAEDSSALLAAAGDCHYADLAELYEHLEDGERGYPYRR